MASAYQLPIHVETHGSSGRPILLLHGFACSSFTWRYWAPRLAQSHTVVLVDLKGHGSAPAPADGRYSPVDQADLVYRQILRQDLTGVTLVGHSTGGAIALLVALRLIDAGEERLDRLALIASTGFRQPLSPFIRLARGWFGRLLVRAYPKGRMVRRILRSVVHDPDSVTESQVLGYADPLRQAACQLAILETAAQLVPDDPEVHMSRYPEIDLPTLLLWGDHDHVVPLWVGERFAKTLPNATLHVLEDCGHLPPEETWEKSLEVFRGFLES